jgi:hypothetical protein
MAKSACGGKIAENILIFIAFQYSLDFDEISAECEQKKINL